MKKQPITTPVVPVVHARVTPALKADLERLALKDRRKEADMVRLLLEEAVAARNAQIQ